MKSIIIVILTTLLLTNVTIAQKSYEEENTGEFGITAGGAHYFGDLNTRASFSRAKPAFGIFYRKQFGEYVGVRLSGHYAQLGFSDVYSKNEFQRQRNLSFNTNIFEVAIQGDFNFFQFTPQDPAHSFTPYVTLGIGVFNFDPYAFLDGRKVFLRPLGTEGQTTGYMGRKPYSVTALMVPFGGGLKYNLTEKINISFELAHRFTFTDYLDDVSSTYAGADKFPPGPNGTSSDALLLQDRSYELDKNNLLGVEGRQRGFSKQKDQYIIGEIGVSFNLSRYRCPTAN